MANYAEIVNGKVTRVIVVDGTEAEALAWIAEHISTELWILTKEDGSVGGKYAGPGDEYHADVGKVSSPQPFDSWSYDADTNLYLPPLPRPIAVAVGFAWFWVEAAGNWVRRAIGASE